MHMRWDPVRIQGAPTPTIKNHSATAISRTEMLVFGGYDGRRNHNELYLFNSATTTWTVLTSPEIQGRAPAGRNGHTATLADRRLFIIGGWLGSGPLAADDIDLATWTWTQPPVLGTPPGPCNMHTADFIPHLRSILVFRGGDGREYLNDLHALDVDSLVWRPVGTTGQRPVPRANHSSAVVHGEQIVLFGGWDGHKRLNDIHVLDTRSMVWSTVVAGAPGHHLPHPRAGMTFVRHREDQLFLFGGSGPSAQCYNDLHVYDADAQQWLEVTTVPDDQGHGLMASLLEEEEEEDDEEEEEDDVDGEDAVTTMVAGVLASEGNGMCGPDHPRPRRWTAPSGSRDAWLALGHANPNDIHMPRRCGRPGHGRHPPQQPQLVLMGHGPGRRAGHTCTVLEDRKLFVFGGSYGNEYLNDLFVLDTDPMPRARVTSAVSPTRQLQRALGAFVDSPEFADITFIVEGRVVYAHKVILSALSERFRGMLAGGFREAHAKEIPIPDVRVGTFVKMLEYLYTGDCVLRVVADEAEGGEEEEGERTRRKITEEELAERGRTDSDGDVRMPLQDGSAVIPTPPRGSVAPAVVSPAEVELALELLVVADQYMLDHLKQLCERALQDAVTVDTVGEILAAATQGNARQLKAICHHFLRNHELEWVQDEGLLEGAAGCGPLDDVSGCAAISLVDDQEVVEADGSGDPTTPVAF